MSQGPSYVDLYALEEDARIDLIGRSVMEGKKTVGVLVEDEPGKADRYITKLQEKFPGIRLEARAYGPIKGVVTLRFGPPDTASN